MLTKRLLIYIGVSALFVSLQPVYLIMPAASIFLIAAAAVLGILSLVYAHTELGGIRRKKAPVINSVLVFAAALAAFLAAFAVLTLLLEPYGLKSSYANGFGIDKIAALALGAALFPLVFILPYSALYASSFNRGFGRVAGYLLRKTYIWLLSASVPAAAVGAAVSLLIPGIWSSIILTGISSLLLIWSSHKTISALKDFAGVGVIQDRDLGNRHSKFCKNSNNENDKHVCVKSQWSGGTGASNDVS